MKGLSRAAASLGDFLASSRGAWLRSDSFVYFHAHSGLTGYCLWADPEGEELEVLTSIISASLELERHPSIVDGREVREPPTRLYTLLMRLVTEESPRLSSSVDRLALVPPPGLTGAATAGFFSVVKAPYPVEIFEELTPALEWLGQPADLARELDDLIAASRGVPAFLHRMRAHIEETLHQPAIREIARKLGMSERTLHRRLTDQGTSFGDEVGRARVNAAKSLLRDTDMPVSRIGLEVGCASGSSFSILFRKREGTTPTAYRAATRGADVKKVGGSA
jgi:AraC-like DNA-binding protein